MQRPKLTSAASFCLRLRPALYGLSLLLLSASSAAAAPVTVGAFGEQGWKSDDTRSAPSGTDLVGINNTHAGKPGQPATAADDTAIAAQIKFGSGPVASPRDSVSIDGTASGNGKSSFSVISPAAGFGTGASLLDPSFNATYAMYKQHTGAGSTLAFKIGLQSTDWGNGPGQSQNGFTAVRSGESFWDLLLVHVPIVTNNTWETVSVDHDTGTWLLFDQATNLFFTPPGSIGPANTLDGWNADAFWGPRLFGAGAKVTSIQFGLGSAQPIAIGHVDYLQTTLLNGGDVVNFVPEPSTLVLAGIGAVGLCLAARRRRVANRT